LIERFCEGTLLRIRDCQVEVAQVMTSGQCRTLEHYREKIGELTGLRKAEAVIQDLYKSLVETKYLTKEGEGNESGTGSQLY
jgi:hypothetical protein